MTYRIRDSSVSKMDRADAMLLVQYSSLPPVGRTYNNCWLLPRMFIVDLPLRLKWLSRELRSARELVVLVYAYPKDGGMGSFIRPHAKSVRNLWMCSRLKCTFRRSRFSQLDVYCTASRAFLARQTITFTNYTTELLCSVEIEVQSNWNLGKAYIIDVESISLAARPCSSHVR